MSAKVIQLTIKTDKAKPRKSTKKPKRPTASARKRLLSALRSESRARWCSGYSMDENTPLVELARAAAYSTKRFVTWGGIRFPLRHGWYLTIIDPETGAPLISTKGGVF